MWCGRVVSRKQPETHRNASTANEHRGLGLRDRGYILRLLLISCSQNVPEAAVTYYYNEVNRGQITQGRSHHDQTAPIAD